jgi:hypothetical protein
MRPCGVCSSSAQAAPCQRARPTSGCSPAMAGPAASLPSSSAKVVTARAPARRRHSGSMASAAGSTTRPSTGSAAMALPFSTATASSPSRNSWCSRCALLTSTTVGAASRASCAISPGWLVPSSTTPARWPGRSASSVSGRPMWLLRLPRVANAASPWAARRQAATICVTVVLPLLPTTTARGSVKPARQPAASCCKACSESATSRPASPAACSPCSASAAAAPAARALAR